MKYYKLKENDLIIYNLEKIITQKDEENYKGGCYVGTIENSLCKSIEALKKEIYEWCFKYEIDEEDKNKVLNAYKLIEEIISRAGIEEYEVDIPMFPELLLK